MTSSKFIIPADYAHWLSSLKTRISGAQQRAALAVNQAPPPWRSVISTAPSARYAAPSGSSR